MKCFMGIDPDLHATGIAIIDEKENLLDVGCVKVKSGKEGYKGREAVLEMVRAAVAMDSPHSPSCTHALIASAVESQEVSYSARSGTNPGSLIPVASVSGIFLVWSQLWGSQDTELYLPAPQAWKGSVPKGIHQARICKRLGWTYTLAGSKKDKGNQYTVPVDLRGFNKGDWKHIMDAVGLALYAKDRWEKEQ